MTFPIYVLCSNWQHEPFLLRHVDARYLAVFTVRGPALKLAESYHLLPPQGVAQVDDPDEYLVWLTAAKAKGAGEVWLDAAVACAAIDPCARETIDDAIRSAAAADAEP